MNSRKAESMSMGRMDGRMDGWVIFLEAVALTRVKC